MRFPLSVLLSVCILLPACSSPQSSAINELKQRQYQFSVKDFLLAAAAGDIPILVLFGKAGMDVNLENSDGRTALMEASKNGKFEATSLLLSAGADPKVTDKNGRDALIDSAAGGHSEIARLLLEHGAIRNNRNDEGWTALSISAFKGKAEMVSLLAGQASQKDLDEALLLASFSGNKKTVANLLSQGAYIDPKSPEKHTPLMIAAKAGHFETVSLLLQNKASQMAVDQNGKTAAQLAFDNGHHNIHRLITDGSFITSDDSLLMAATVSRTPTDQKSAEASKPLVALNGSKIRSQYTGDGPLNSFKLSDYKERKLPVSLKSVDGVYAIVMRLDSGDSVTDVKVTKGELIHGTKYRLQEIEPAKVRSNGLPENTLNTARVRIQHIESGANHLLVKDTTPRPIDSYAVLTAPSSDYRYVAKTGDIFQTVDPTNGERDFQVISIEQTDIAFKELASAKIVRLSRSSPLR